MGFFICHDRAISDLFARVSEYLVRCSAICFFLGNLGLERLELLYSTAAFFKLSLGPGDVAPWVERGLAMSRLTYYCSLYPSRAQFCLSFELKIALLKTDSLVC